MLCFGAALFWGGRVAFFRRVGGGGEGDARARLSGGLGVDGCVRYASLHYTVLYCSYRPTSME